MDAFLLAFWPNFAATVAGVVIGVPIALWLNARGGKAVDQKRMADERLRLRRGLDAVVLSLKHNESLLGELIASVKNKHDVYDTGLNLSAWEACHEQIVPYLKDAELSRRIAYHFERLAGVARLVAIYLNLGVGVASAVGGSQKTRETLAANIANLANLLITDAESLQVSIKAALSIGESDA